ERRLRSRHSCPRSPIFRAIKGEHFVGAGHWPPSDSTLSARDRLIGDKVRNAIAGIGLPLQGPLLGGGGPPGAAVPCAFSRHRHACHCPIASKTKRSFPGFLLHK